MIKTYILTSKAAKDTHVEFYFNGEDLAGYKIISETVRDNVHQYVSQIVQGNVKLQQFLQVNKANSNVSLIELDVVITFDMFWDRYGDKINSSKKKSQLKWNKMPLSERIKAFDYIQKYFRNIPAGCEKKYAETYLNSELWNN